MDIFTLSTGGLIYGVTVVVAPPPVVDGLLERQPLVGPGGYVLPLLPLRIAIGDTTTPLKVQLVDQDHQPVDLTAKTVDAKILLATDGSIVRDWAPVTIDDSATGKVSLTLSAGESATARTLIVHVRVATNATLAPAVHPPAASGHKLAINVGTS